jgi:hypothetical protein
MSVQSYAGAYTLHQVTHPIHKGLCYELASLALGKMQVCPSKYTRSKTRSSEKVSQLQTQVERSVPSPTNGPKNSPSRQLRPITVTQTEEGFETMEGVRQRAQTEKVKQAGGFQKPAESKQAVPASDQIELDLDRKFVPPKGPFIEFPFDEFPGQFKETHQIEENQFIKCNLPEGSITSYEIGRGLTLFGKSISGVEDEYIYAYHISPHSTLEEIIQTLKTQILKDVPSMIVASHRLYLIGGLAQIDYVMGRNVVYKASDASKQLLDRILDAVEKVYGSPTNIVQRIFNPNARYKYKTNYVDANMQLNGKLTFRRTLNGHDERDFQFSPYF